MRLRSALLPDPYGSDYGETQQFGPQLGMEPMAPAEQGRQRLQRMRSPSPMPLRGRTQEPPMIGQPPMALRGRTQEPPMIGRPGQVEYGRGRPVTVPLPPDYVSANNDVPPGYSGNVGPINIDPQYRRQTLEDRLSQISGWSSDGQRVTYSQPEWLARMRARDAQQPRVRRPSPPIETNQARPAAPGRTGRVRGRKGSKPIQVRADVPLDRPAVNNPPQAQRNRLDDVVVRRP